MIPTVTITAQPAQAGSCIPFPGKEELLDWHLQQLQADYARGLRQLSLSCRPLLRGESSPLRPAYLVLRGAMDFLYAHPDISRLTLLCGEEAWLQAMTFQWNMWYADRRPEQDP